MPKFIYFFIPSIFIVLLLAAISNKYQLTPRTVPSTTSPTPIPETTWQTYVNEKYSFEFQYPKNEYQINPDDNRTLKKIDYPYAENSVGPQVTIDVLISNDSELKIVKKEVDSCEVGMGCKLLPIAIKGSNTFTNFTGPSYVVEGDYYIKKTPDNKHYVQFVFLNFDNNTRDQILSTFKFLPTPTSTTSTKDVFHLNSKTVKVGNIKKVYQKNNQPYFDIDYVEWIDDDSAPNGYRIENGGNQLTRTFKLPLETEINCLDIHDVALLSKIDVAEFNKTISYDSDVCFNTNLFKIDFDQAGQVNWLMQVYTP
ncbi:MAG: hypothetical protein WCV93_05870 [Candidatus Shapirobacteria bacterium]|jgi:hypothetical protein